MAKDLKMAIERIRALGDDFKRNNIRIIGVPEPQRSNPNEKNTVKDIIAKKFPELEKAGIQIQGVRRVPAKRDPNKKTPRHIIVRMTDAVDRDTILQAARSKKEITYKGTPLRFTADLSEETL